MCLFNAETDLMENSTWMEGRRDDGRVRVEHFVGSVADVQVRPTLKSTTSRLYTPDRGTH